MTGDNQDSIEVRYEDENIWLTQKMMAQLYDVGIATINEHTKKVFAGSEFDEGTTIRKFRIVQTEGDRQVNRSVYGKRLTAQTNWQAIIAAQPRRIYPGHGSPFGWAELEHNLEKVKMMKLRPLQKDAIPEKEARLEKLKASAANVDSFIEEAKRYTAIDELTPELLRLFIQRIEIGERGKRYSRSSTQSIRIIYRDIGAMDSPMEQEERQSEGIQTTSEETIQWMPA